MVTLLGSLIGFLSSLVPDFLRVFQDKSDKKHELEIFDRQVLMLKANHLSRINEMEAAYRLAETKALYASAKPTGVKWVDALSGTVRPIITYTFFLLYAFVKISQVLCLMRTTSSMEWTSALIRVWHEEDQALFAAVMAFWFGQRALRYSRK